MSSRVTRALAATITSGVMLLAGLVVAAAPSSAAVTYSGQDGRIAFVRSDQVYSMNRWGGAVRRLTTSGVNSHPEWSPDGRRIAFLHEADGRRDVWVMSQRGTRMRAVTASGDVTSAGATWSADGLTLAYAKGGELHTIGSMLPAGDPRPVLGYQTGGFCEDDPADLRQVYVNQLLAWSPDGTRLAVRSDSDCQLDHRVDHLHLATGEQQMVLGSGADCCGYVEYLDLFWGPGNEFGWTERDLGAYGEDTHAPSYVVYPGFVSRRGDVAAAPSPSGGLMALAHASGGTATIVVARSDGSHRRVLTIGSQPDWQVRPG